MGDGSKKQLGVLRALAVNSKTRSEEAAENV